MVHVLQIVSQLSRVHLQEIPVHLLEIPEQSQAHPLKLLRLFRHVHQVPILVQIGMVQLIHQIVMGLNPMMIQINCEPENQVIVMV